MEQIQHESLQQCGLGFLPERVCAVGPLGGGVADEIVDEPQHVLIIVDIGKRVVAERTVGVEQVEHPHLITRFFKKTPGLAQKFGLGISNDIGAAALQNVGQGMSAAFACTGAANDQHIEVAAVPAAVQPDGEMFGQDKVLPIPVAFGHVVHAAPAGGAVFLAAAVVFLVGSHDKDGDRVRDIGEICALNTDDLQWIQVQGYHLAVFWVCKRMTRKDKKYAVDRDIPSPHVRRLPLFEWIQRQLDTRAATLEDPPQSRPLMGGGPHGTVRITPDTAEKELAARLTALGIRVRTHTSEADSDNDLVQLLRSDAAYCAREVMHLRDAEQELLLDLAFTSTDARHYWDPDCDETMFKLWQAGHRLVPHPAGKLQVSVHCAHSAVLLCRGTQRQRGQELPAQLCRGVFAGRGDRAGLYHLFHHRGHRSSGGQQRVRRDGCLELCGRTGVQPADSGGSHQGL